MSASNMEKHSNELVGYLKQASQMIREYSDVVMEDTDEVKTASALSYYVDIDELRGLVDAKQ